MGDRQTTHANLTVTLDGMPFSLPLEAVPQKRSGVTGDSAFKYACPSCDGAEGVRQQYVCDHGHGPFTESELARRRELEPDTFAMVTPTEVEMAKSGGMAKDQITLRLHPAVQVEEATRPGAVGYRLRPPVKKGVSAPTKPYGILLGFASNPDVAIIGELNLRGTVKLYRLGVHRGQLLLTELLRPDDLADTDEIEVEATEAEIGRARALAESLVTDFDPNEYRNLTRERVAQLVAEKMAAGEGVVPDGAAAPVKATASIVDILDLIERSVEDRKPHETKEVA